jgi:hypothetical protein
MEFLSAIAMKDASKAADRRFLIVGGKGIARHFHGTYHFIELDVVLTNRRNELCETVAIQCT